MIINTTNNDNNPVIIISGNVDNENIACSGATLTIGSKSNQHYQSLLPIEMFRMNTNPGNSHKNQETNKATHGDPLEETSHKINTPLHQDQENNSQKITKDYPN